MNNRDAESKQNVAQSIAMESQKQLLLRGPTTALAYVNLTFKAKVSFVFQFNVNLLNLNSWNDKLSRI